MTIQALINKIFRANQTQNNTVSWSGSNGLKSIQEDIVGTIRERTFFTVPTTTDLINQGFNNAILCYVQDEAFYRWSATGIPNGTTIFPANDGGVWVQETIGQTDGTVTSIGITAPAAFTVTNSPVTTSGVIDIAANGTASEYIKGDGTLGTLPGGTVTNVTASSPLVSSGGTAPNISTSMSTNKLIGRSTAGAGEMEEITVGAGLSLSGGTLSTTGGGTVTSVSALTINSTGTDLSSTVANPTTTPVITLSVPTASALNRGVLSSADWTAFNSKQNAITLTTTGTSGAATLVGATLNIPQYQSVITNPVTGTGTTNYHAKWTSSSTLNNSLIYDDGTNVGIGTASPSYKLDVNGDFRAITSGIVGNAAAFGGGFGGLMSVRKDLDITAGGTYRNSQLAVGSASTNGALLLTYSTTGIGSIQAATMGVSFSSLAIQAFGGNLMVGTTTDGGQKLQVVGDTKITGATSAGNYSLSVYNSSNAVSFYVRGFGDALLAGTLFLGTQNGPNFISNGTLGITSSQGAGNQFVRFTHNNGNNAFRILSNSVVEINPVAGNVLIGTTTDAGYKLDVNGTARVQDTLTLPKNITISGTTAVPQIAGTLSYASSINGQLNGAISGQSVASLYVNIPTYTGTGGTLSFYSIFAGPSYFDRINVGAGSASSNIINDTSTATLRLQGFNALTGASGVGSGSLIFTNRTSGTQLGIAATYGGGGSRLTIFNEYNDGPTSRILINMAGVNTACFFADGSLQIGNGETTISSAILSASSTTRGFLQPRMTTTQRNAIVTPATGLAVYNTTTNTEDYYNGTTWVSLQTSAAAVKSFGAWQHDVTQTAAVNNTGYGVRFDTADISGQGIAVQADSLGNNTLIKMTNAGYYNIQFSFQFQNIDNQLHDVSIWLRKNGQNTAADVAGSGGFVSIPNSHGGTPGHCIAAWNYFVQANANDYFQLVWSTDSATNVTMEFYPAGSPPPSSASAILTVNQVN